VSKRGNIVKIFVYIVESPGWADIASGRTEGRVLTETLRIDGIEAEYNLVKTHVELEQALGAQFTDAQKHRPMTMIFLHWSSHGNADGVGLTDGTFLDWKGLSDLLVQVNRGYLGLCMSSCYGYEAYLTNTRGDSMAPFFALVGNKGELDWSDGAIGYAVFYHRFSKGSTFKQAIEAMNLAADNKFEGTLRGTLLQARQQQQTQSATGGGNP
jgi:hypothetical protein